MRGRRVLAVLCAAVLAVALWITIAAADRAVTGPVVPASAPGVVTVHAGDTLWSIAGRIAPDRDPRAVVDALRRSNHLDSSTVRLGQRLVVPH